MSSERKGAMRNRFSFHGEALQSAVVGSVVIVLLIFIFVFLYCSTGSVNVYNVSNTVNVTAEKYVAEEDKININTADSEQLQELDGIGEKTAQKIIDYREANGSFTSFYELTEVNGISDTTVDKIKPYIKLK